MMCIDVPVPIISLNDDESKAAFSKNEAEGNGETDATVQDGQQHCTRSDQSAGRKKAQNRKVGAKSQLDCDVCGESFKTKNMLTRHKSLKHSSAKEHPCNQCERVFRTKMQLREHQRSHEREQCPICKKTLMRR